MMRLLTVLFLFPQLCFSQSYFMDIGNGASDKPQGIVVDADDNIWIKSRFWTGTHFTSAISKFDKDLNLLFQDTLNTGLTFREGLIIDDSLVIEAGNHANTLLLLKRNFSGALISIDSFEFREYYQFTTFGLEANDEYYLAAGEAKKEGIEGLFLYFIWIDKLTSTIDSMQFLHSGYYSRIWTLREGANNDFYALVDTIYPVPHLNTNYTGRRIYKVNKDKSINTLFVNNELTNGLGFGHYFVRFPDGHIIFNAMHTEIGQKELFLIDSTGRYLGRSDYPYIEIRAKHMGNIELYDAESFIACGYKQRQGWLMKGRKDMSIVWQRLINIPFDLGSFTIHHIKVLSDGTLLAVGDAVKEVVEVDGNTYRNTDVLLLKLDADGCIEPGCGEEETILLDNYEVLYSYQTRGIDLYPNPSSGIINLGRAYEGYYQVVSAGGQAMAQGQLSSEQQLDLTTLPAGWYTLQIIDQASGELAQGSFVKQ